jgi:hypothetical protein
MLLHYYTEDPYNNIVPLLEPNTTYLDRSNQQDVQYRNRKIRRNQLDNRDLQVNIIALSNIVTDIFLWSLQRLANLSV